MPHLISLFALILQQSDDSTPILLASLISLCCGAIYVILSYAGLWKMFNKANKPGWAAIIPFYNIWVMLQIVGRPNWWIILFFIPIVQVIVLVFIALDIAESYGRGIPFALGTLFFPFVFFIILGFGDSQYKGPAAAQKMARDWRG